MAELADAPDLGSGGRPCRFKSCHPHRIRDFEVYDLGIPYFYVITNFVPNNVNPSGENALRRKGNLSQIQPAAGGESRLRDSLFVVFAG